MMKYEVPAGVVVQKVGDETVLLNLDSGHYYGLDPVGTRMLELVRELSETTAVVSRLAQEYEAEADVLEKDLSELLGKLESNGLVRRAD